MVIAIQSTPKKKNNCVGIASLISSITAIMCNKRTLVIQLCNKNLGDVGEKLDENVQIEHNQLTKTNTYNFESLGLDAVLSEIGTTHEMTPEFLEQKCVEYIVASNKSETYSILDVLAPSKEVIFEEKYENDITPFEALIECAEKVYEYIFVVMPRSKVMREKLLHLCNTNIVCVTQGRHNEVMTFNDLTKANKRYDVNGNVDNSTKDIFVIADYDEESEFTIKKLSKEYGKDNPIYACFHNSNYKDAFIKNDVLSFVRKNFKVGEYDTNYIFMSELKDLIGEFASDVREDNYTNNMLIADLVSVRNIEKSAKEIVMDENYEDFYIKQTKKAFGRIKEEVEVEYNSEQTTAERYTAVSDSMSDREIIDDIELTGYQHPVFEQKSENEANVENNDCEKINIELPNLSSDDEFYFLENENGTNN